MNVAQGDCKDIGTPRSSEEAYAVHNLGIKPADVRKMAQAGYKEIKHFEDAAAGIDLKDAPDWREFPEFPQTESANPPSPPADGSEGSQE